MSAAVVESNVNAEKRAKRFWIALVLFLFVIQSTIMGTVMHLAIGDPSAAVVPDYHDAALNWDETRESLEASRRLGWTIQLDVSDVADERGMRAIEMTILNADRQGIDELGIHGKLYHHADAAMVVPVKLNSVGQGRYLNLVPAKRVGNWQLELSIDGAEEKVAESITFVVDA